MKSLKMESNSLMELNKIKQGDSLEVLKTLPSESIDCAITSPPYWALRDYGVVGQLGLEPTFQEYITKLCDIFDEVKRVLKKDGTCWINLGDTYSGNKEGKTDNKVSSYLKDTSTGIHKKATIQEKCLCQIPSRFAIEMTNRGWILRNEIIWHKPNAMPSSASDRFTVDFEKVFFFVKNKKYNFEQQFVSYAPSSDVRYRQALRANKSYATKQPYKSNTPYSTNYKRGHGSVVSRANDSDGLLVGGHNPNGRNVRTVWTIPTKPFSEAHFATFPEKLIEPMLKAGCPKNGIVLDIFMGAGTTGLVAKKLGRNYLGIELNPEYIKIAEARINGQTQPLPL
jgi:site-specific DNA-methyltransferase (adenine-specific)